MKIYIAARFSKRPEANALAQELKEMGHVITSRWVKPDSDHVAPTGLSQQAADSERQRFAVEDLEDVIACDCCVSLMEEPRNNSRGGRHVEFGIAVGLNKALVVIGPRETVFHHLPNVQHYETVSDFLDVVQGYAQIKVAEDKPPRGWQLSVCHANRDGECNHGKCPQLRDKEPQTSGRHCPLDTDNDEL